MSLYNKHTSKNIHYDIGDFVLILSGLYENKICKIVRMEGEYIYVHPDDMEKYCILEVYRNEIVLIEKYYKERDRKINEILK